MVILMCYILLFKFKLKYFATFYLNSMVSVKTQGHYYKTPTSGHYYAGTTPHPQHIFQNIDLFMFHNLYFSLIVYLAKIVCLEHYIYEVLHRWCLLRSGLLHQCKSYYMLMFR